MVEGYDVRAAAREQVESLGAKFVDTGVSAEGSRRLRPRADAEEKQKQQDALAKHVAQADAVITTAAIPGRAAPKIISRSHGGSHEARRAGDGSGRRDRR